MDFSKIKEWLIPEGKVKSVSVDGKVVWKAGGWVPDVPQEPELEQLTEPKIALDGDILTMEATDDKTEEFVIFVDGVEKATVANECMEASPNTVSGTWYFNEVLNFPDTAIDEYVNCIGDYTNHGSDYNGVVTEIIVGWQYTNPTYKALRYFGLNSSNRTWHIVPYGENGWEYTDDRTITFDGEQSVSKEFYEWLDENAKRDEEPITFDLSTLNLSAGTHTIMVKARASGYTDSEPSNAVSYTVIPVTVSYWGKFTFHQDLGAIEKNQFPPTAVKFTSNNVNYTQISCGEGTIMYDNTVVYNNGWTNEAYRSIDYGGSSNNTQKIDKRFGDWFDAHSDAIADEGGCFVAGTPVLMADGSTKSIENVVVGDTVLTYDESIKTYGEGRVIKLIVHKTNTIATLTLSNGTVIELTPGHPIYTRQGWATLKENDGHTMVGLNDEILSTDNKYYRITAIDYRIFENFINVYNLTIDGEPNYFVGETSILAHNGGSK